LGPFMRSEIEPFLHSYCGWIPLFSGDQQQSGVLVAIVVLTMMTIPITSSVCRELFQGVPAELKEGALALGATRWEMVRDVVVYNVRGGVVAGVILGLGRSLGEAIAVTQVIGNWLGPVLVRAFHALDWNFFVKGPAVFGQTGGGIAPALVGTLLLVLVATAMALPVGVLIALYVSEFARPRVADQIKLWLDVLNGFPS